MRMCARVKSNDLTLTGILGGRLIAMGNMEVWENTGFKDSDCAQKQTKKSVLHYSCRDLNCNHCNSTEDNNLYRMTMCTREIRQGTYGPNYSTVRRQ